MNHSEPGLQDSLSACRALYAQNVPEGGLGPGARVRVQQLRQLPQVPQPRRHAGGAIWIVQCSRMHARIRVCLCVCVWAHAH